MSIGEALTAARRRAGMSVAQVSQRTRIREALIRAIERDDYSATGGDFYTRGHIRSIAKAVGADPVPLIEEYDAARRQQDEITQPDAIPPVPPAPPGSQRAAGGPAGQGRDAQQDWDAGHDWDAGQDWRRVPHPGSGQARPDWRHGAGGQARPDWPGPAGRQAGEDPASRPSAPDVPSGPEPPARQAPAVWPRNPGPQHARRRPNWAMALGVALVVALGLLGYQFFSGTGGSPPAAPAAHGHPAVHRSSTPSPRPAASQSAAASTRTVVVHLTAIRGCSVEFTTPSGGYLSRSHVPAGVSASWTFRQAVDMRLCNPARVKLTVNGTDPVPGGVAPNPITLHISPGHPATITVAPTSPAPASPAPAASLTPVSASAFGPGSSQGDNPQLAPLAIDGSRATAWHTDWYTSPRFGNLYPGTGLLLDMGRTVTITRARITLGPAQGADFQLRVGDAPTMSALAAVAQSANSGGVVRLNLAAPARGRYVLIWFTRLPPQATGTYEASVYNVALRGRA